MLPERRESLSGDFKFRRKRRRISDKSQNHKRRVLEITGYFCSFWFGELIQEFAFGLDSKVQVVKIVVTLKSVGLSCFLVCWKVRSKTCLTRVE
jgi:hypothetical protein